MMLNSKRFVLFIIFTGLGTLIYHSKFIQDMWKKIFKKRKYILLLNWEEFHEGKQKMVIQNDFKDIEDGKGKFQRKCLLLFFKRYTATIHS